MTKRGLTELERRHSRLRLLLAIDPKQAVDEELKHLESRFTGGDKGSLALAIKVCGFTRTPLPTWAANAWAAACNDVAAGEATWDDVLDEGHLTPKQRARQSKQKRLALKLLDLLPFLRDEPTDRDFFPVIANHLEITEAQARHLYYALPEDMRLPPIRPRRPRRHSKKVP